MKIRTITQLPSADVFVSSWMEMSVPLADQPGMYVSRKASYEAIKNDISSTTTNSIARKYSLDNQSGPISLSTLATQVNALSNENCNVKGIKDFKDWPIVSADFPVAESSTDARFNVYGNDFEYILPNVKKIKELVDDNVVFMSTTKSLVAEGNPLPQHKRSDTDDSVVESLEYGNTIGQGKFYFWQIDAQQTDSSTSIHDKDSGSVDGYEEIRDTGNLVVWGWLAENITPPPAPEQCWVALFAKLKCENYNNTEMDVPVQVKPWIRGVNSPIIQYVSFNIPVRKGLRLKIKTGFPVNGDNSGLQNPGSLTFLDGNIPNAFFGYVIK